jgi:hypothetical protein
MKHHCLLVAIGFLLAGLSPAAQPAPRHPNVPIIAVDDLNHWVGYLGRNK